MFPGFGGCFGCGETYNFENKTSNMHPDSAGAIIGISLAGSILIVAIVFLCVLQFCCKDELKPIGNRRRARPSTSSRNAFANFGFFGSSRDVHVRTLSAADLEHQHNHTGWPNRTPINNSTTGIMNPIWQLNCHACGVVAATPGGSRLQVPCHIHSSQVSLSASNPCLFCHHENDIRNNPNGYDFEAPDGSVSSSRFQYFAPQLFSPSESPPPYPGHADAGVGDTNHTEIGSRNVENDNNENTNASVTK